MYVVYFFIFIIFTLLLIIILSEYNKKNRIKQTVTNLNYDENMLLKDVNILGTHDSMSYNINNYFSPFAKTQNFDLQTQYNLGVRYFDLRFKKKENGDVVAFHGIVDLKIKREEIFEFFFNIIKKEKTFIILNILFEDRSMQLYTDIIKYLQDNNFLPNCIFNNSNIPKIKNLYNKIFFSNIYEKDDIYKFLIFDYNAININFNIKKEDVNEGSISDKIQILKKVLNERNGNKINIIHFSLQTNIYLSVNYIARKIHKEIENDGILKNKKGFILVFDFVDDLYNGLINQIEL